MMSLFLGTFIYIALAQTNTASCIFEQEFDIAVNEDLIDRAQFGNRSMDVIQTTEKLLLLDQDLNQLGSVIGPRNASYHCNKVIGYPLSDIFFVACQQNGSIPFMQAYQCQSANCKAFGENVYIPLGIQLFDKAIIIGNTLLILQSDKILFYTIVMQQTSWYLRTTSYVLDKQYFNRTSLNISDFDTKLFYIDSQLTYRILIAEQNDGVLWVDAILRVNNLVPYNSGSINLRQTIFYLKSTTKFRSVAILTSTETLTEFIVSTNDEDSYQIQLQQQFAQIQQVLTRYKDWKLINQIKVNGNIVAIPYQNFQNVVVTALFKVSVSSEIQNNLKVDYQDLLISSSMNHFLFYFTDSNSVVYKSDTDSFTKCILSKYNLME